MAILTFSDWLKQRNESTAFTRARAAQKKGTGAKTIPDCEINAHDTYSGVAGDPDMEKPKKKNKESEEELDDKFDKDDKPKKKKKKSDE